MKVRVAYTVDADDDFRRRIATYYGMGGLASREDVKTWFVIHGHSMNDDLMDMDMDEEEEEEEER